MPDTPYKEPNEMREKIIRYEPAGQGHPVHQGRLLSCWLLLVPLPSLIPSSYPSTPPLAYPLVIIYLLPRSSLFWSSPFVIRSSPLLVRRADTSRRAQPTTTYYSKVISLSRHRSARHASPCLPPLLLVPPRVLVIRGDEPAGRSYRVIQSVRRPTGSWSHYRRRLSESS